MTALDVDRLEPGWVEQASIEDLSETAQRLAELAGELERTRQLERALRAMTEAVRAQRRVVAQQSDEELLDGGGWRPLAMLLGHRSRLLRVTGRPGEVAAIDQEIADLHQRLTRATVLATVMAEPEMAPVPDPPVAEVAPEPELVGEPEVVPAADDVEESLPTDEVAELRERVGRLRGSGDLAGARAAQEQLVAALERTDPLEGPELAVAVSDLATLCWELGEHRAARAAAERAVAIHERSGRPANSGAARDLTVLGGMRWQLAELPGAREILTRAVAATEQAYGADHVEVARCLAYLGTVHHDLDELPAARTAQERALAILDHRLGSEHRETLFVVHSLGKTLRALGDTAAARAAQQRAQAGYERTLAGEQQELGRDHPRVARTLRRLRQVRRELAGLAVGGPA
jgi:tetratricopeptide (TPR) repeat protein